ncbi:MAG: hypothetical protein JW924_12380 [Fusobacteriaceae bacterium]|nr:hypothetical protein [Fusobacteriaceae bacterium]
MDVRISNNTIFYKNFCIDDYLHLIGNTILIFYRITNSNGEIIKEEIPNKAAAVFYIDKFLN